MRRIPNNIRQLIAKQRAKLPLAGVRGLAKSLKDEYGLNISKSTIQRALKHKGLAKALPAHKVKEVEECGLLLLKSLDYQIGLFDYLSRGLKVCLPEIDEYLLKKLLILKVFSALTGANSQKALKKQGLLRITSLGSFPSGKIKYCDKILSQQKPVIDLAPLKQNLLFVSTLKFHFNNGSVGYCDAKMSTLWDGPCDLKYFFLPLKAALARLKEMIKYKTLIIGYTKSFDYLPKPIFDFFKGAESGLKKISFLGIEGEILKEINISLPKIDLILGHYPKLLEKGAIPLNSRPKLRRAGWRELGELYYSNTLTKFLLPLAKESSTLSNILMKKTPNSPPAWGLITTSGAGFKPAALIKKYLYLWPNINQIFIEEMVIIEESLFSVKKESNYLLKMLPAKLAFGRPMVFFLIGQILSAMFKELIWGWEPKGNQGNFVTGKDYIGVFFKKQIPARLKINFNKACLYLDSKTGLKRAFIL